MSKHTNLCAGIKSALDPLEGFICRHAIDAGQEAGTQGTRPAPAPPAVGVYPLAALQLACQVLHHIPHPTKIHSNACQYACPTYSSACMGMRQGQAGS